METRSSELATTSNISTLHCKYNILYRRFPNIPLSKFMKCSFVFQFLHCFLGFLEPQKKAQTSFTQGKQIDGWLEVSDKLKGLDGRTMQGQHKSTSKMILIIIKRRMHRKISPKPLQNIRIPQQYNDKQYGNCLLVCVAPV